MNEHFPRYGRMSEERGGKFGFLVTLTAFAGLVPYMGLAAWLWTHQGGIASRVLAVYAALMLVFAGAVHWGWALAGHAESRRYPWTLLPLLVGWILASLPWPAFALPLLAAATLILWYGERRWFAERLPSWYLALRMQTSILAAVAIVAAWIAVLVHAT